MSERGGWSPFFGGRGEHAGAAAARRNALRTRRVENQFAVQLRRLARTIGDIVNGMYEDDPSEWLRIEQALDAYGSLIEPWATAVARRVLAEVARRDAAGWHALGKIIHRGLLDEIATAPIGVPLRQLLAEQVHLITSLPREAAERVHKLSLEAVTGGRRWEEIAADLKDSGEVSASRANLIARTETGRASTELLRVRAVHAGSEGYIWRTARDRDVRRLHRLLEGTFHRWDDPPVSGERGERSLPGAIYNCRCWAEPVLEMGDLDQQLGRRPMNPEYLAALRAQGFTTGTAFEG